MSKTKVKVEFKPSPEGIRELGNEISENPEKFRIETECPQCHKMVKLTNSEGVCPNCGFRLIAI